MLDALLWYSRFCSQGAPDGPLEDRRPQLRAGPPLECCNVEPFKSIRKSSGRLRTVRARHNCTRGCGQDREHGLGPG